MSEAALELAERFHEAYERLAPEYGYATRPETRRFDRTSPNGKLMVAVCEEILGSHVVLTKDEAEELLAILEDARELFYYWDIRPQAAKAAEMIHRIGYRQCVAERAKTTVQP